MLTFHRLRCNDVLPSHFREFVYDSDQQGLAGADRPESADDQRVDVDPEERGEESFEEDYVHRSMIAYEARMRAGDPQRQSDEEDGEEHVHGCTSSCASDPRQISARLTLGLELEAARAVLRLLEYEYEECCRCSQGRSARLRGGMAPSATSGPVRSRSRSRRSAVT
jgi:hypothetical protein